MLKNKFSPALLALLVMVAASGSAYAADAIDESAAPANAPISITETVETSGEAQTPAAETPAVEAPAAETPAVLDPATEAPAAEVPAVETPAAEAPAAVEPTVEAPAVVDPAAEAPAAEVPVVEAPAVEPVAATLTITHRIMVGDQNNEIVQTIDGLTVGQTINLADYVINTSDIVCISSPAEVVIDEASDTATVEYNLAAVSDTNADEVK